MLPPPPSSWPLAPRLAPQLVSFSPLHRQRHYNRNFTLALRLSILTSRTSIYHPFCYSSYFRPSTDNHKPNLRQLQTANTWYEIIDTEGSWQFVDEDVGIILELDAAGTLIQSAPGGVGINTATPTATLDVDGTANISGDSTLSGNAAVGGTLDVTGASTGSTATYSSDVSVGGNLGVTGTTTLATGVVLSEDAHTITHSGATSLAITSTTGYVSVEDVEINASSIGVSTKQDLVGLAADGVTIDGTLTTTGDISVAAITASAAVTAASTLNVASDTTVGGTFAATGTGKSIHFTIVTTCIVYIYIYLYILLTFSPATLTDYLCVLSSCPSLFM